MSSLTLVCSSCFSVIMKYFQTNILPHIVGSNKWSCAKRKGSSQVLNVHGTHRAVLVIVLDGLRGEVTD